MAITWGAIAGGYGRIGIDIAISNTATQSKVTVTTWFWSKYSISDSSNQYYYNSNATSATTLIGSKTLKTTDDSGNGWSTSNQVKLGQSTYTYDRETKARTINYAIKLTGVDRVGATMTHTKGVTIPALAKYTVSYNANGGSGVPDEQTKYHGVSLTLSSTKPTKSGYTFVCWNAKADGSGGTNFNPGGTYTGNANITLYAQWKKTITLSYDANGGSGAPDEQSATVYNATTSATFTIPSTKPTWSGYTFLGWSLSDTATSASYAAGDTISLSGNKTLYAVWRLNTYKVTYYGTGGTNVPPAQTKTHGTDLVLTKSVPSKQGCLFTGWLWKSGQTTKIYQPGDVYSANANMDLYATWKDALFTVSYDANGGSNAPASQEKTYGVDLTLTSAVPTRKYHTFKGWATSASGSVVYSAGGTYATNADITLYAVWEVAYIIPRITKFAVARCDADGNAQDDGVYAVVNFQWATDEDVSTIKIYWKASTDTAYGNSKTVEATGRSGSVRQVVGGGALSEDLAYNFKIEVADNTDLNSVTRTLPDTSFPIDMLAGGKGVTIGGPAKEEGFHVKMDTNIEGILKASNLGVESYPIASNLSETGVATSVSGHFYILKPFNLVFVRMYVAGFTEAISASSSSAITLCTIGTNFRPADNTPLIGHSVKDVNVLLNTSGNIRIVPRDGFATSNDLYISGVYPLSSNSAYYE